MSVLFTDNFDGEGEGTSPPTNWINDDLNNCEIDDVRAHSAPHSMWLKAKVGVNGKTRHEEAGGFSTEKVTVWIYFPNTTGQRFLFTQETIGPSDTAKQAAYIRFNIGGDIDYYDGIYNDTGQNYTAGWHKIEIVHDLLDADTFELWYDTALIASGAGFRNAVTTLRAIQFFMVTDSDNIWFDDVQISAECKVSPAQAGPMSGGVTI